MISFSTSLCVPIFCPLTTELSSCLSLPHHCLLHRHMMWATQDTSHPSIPFLPVAQFVTSPSSGDCVHIPQMLSEWVTAPLDGPVVSEVKPSPHRDRLPSVFLGCSSSLSALAFLLLCFQISPPEWLASSFYFCASWFPGPNWIFHLLWSDELIDRDSHVAQT